MSRVFVLNEPSAPRLSPALALEIGLNESILLLQIEFWIHTKGHEREKRLWTYRSLSQLQRTFPFWSRDTINNIVHSLQAQKLLFSTHRFNHRTHDKTRWFAINEEGCEKLESIRVLRVRRTLSDNETRLSENRTGLSENRTTLPETYQEKPNNAYTGPAHEDTDAMIEQWAFGVEDILTPQPSLLPNLRPKKRPTLAVDPIPAVAHAIVYRICYRADTESEILTLNSGQRGRVASVLGNLRDAGADLAKLQQFEDWWVNNWRSRDKQTKQYQPPRPEQVQEFWVEAMKSEQKPVDEKVRDNKPTGPALDINSIMSKRAETRGTANGS